MKAHAQTNRVSSFAMYLMLAAALLVYAGCTQNNIPAALESVTAEDGTTWERVTQPGFGNDNNISVAAIGEFKGRIYATTRNDDEGAEVWRTNGDGWEQVEIFSGFKNGIYGNTMLNNLWSKMIVFKGKLYVGFSAGLQGTVLKSSGCEIWRYDGTSWEPVVSDKVDVDDESAITGISGCDENDGDITAQITDSSKNWTTDQWAGGVLQITSGQGAYRRFDIVGNTANTLTIQQNETTGDYGKEYTVCGTKKYSNPFPVYEYDLGPVKVGDSYEIGLGTDENGFGDYWNKTVTEMLEFDGKLYVSTGLNYDNGAQVWYSEDGETWQVTEPANSFGNYHNDPNYKNGLKAVSSSISDIAVSNVSGRSVLYAAGTGTTGEKGRCTRMAKLTRDGWELIVDSDVDANDTGTNENGFGDGMACTMNTGNFMGWSLQHFKDKLYVGINSLGGTRVLYTENGSSEDGSWFFSVGPGTPYQIGFDGELLQTDDPNFIGTYRNIANNLYEFDNVLYAGVIDQKSEKVQTGTPVYKTSDGATWTLVTNDSFGQKTALAFEGFATCFKAMYVGVNNASSSQSNTGGATIFRLAE
jgi:hypothetical protein